MRRKRRKRKEVQRVGPKGTIDSYFNKISDFKDTDKMTGRKRKAETEEVEAERAEKRLRRNDLDLILNVNLNPMGGGCQRAFLMTEPNCADDEKSRGSFASQRKTI